LSTRVHVAKVDVGVVAVGAASVPTDVVRLPTRTPDTRAGICLDADEPQIVRFRALRIKAILRVESVLRILKDALALGIRPIRLSGGPMVLKLRAGGEPGEGAMTYRLLSPRIHKTLDRQP
jgi:hypothetical protein